MDSITQAALGAAVGEAVLGRRLGNRAMAWGAVFGTVPDLDVLFSPFLDTAGQLLHHRGASHSILLMAVAPFVLAPLLARLWKRDGVSAVLAGWFVFLVWSTHVLIDCFTVYGTSVFWPFSDYRAGFNNIFIIDLFYTGPLLVSLAWLAFLRKPQQQAMRRRVCFWGLGLSTAYVCLSLAGKWAASAGFGADLERRGIAFERRMEAPTPFNILLWRAVVDRGDELWVGYRTVFEPHSTPVRWTVYPRGRDAATPFADTREMRALEVFSDGWWMAREVGPSIWVGDLRFGESRTWNADDGTVDNSLAFAWVFTPAPPAPSAAPGAGATEPDRLRQHWAGAREVRDALRRLVLRICGDTGAWESTPRLDGVPGRLPEPLRVEE